MLRVLFASIERSDSCRNDCSRGVRSDVGHIRIRDDQRVALCKSQLKRNTRRERGGRHR